MDRWEGENERDGLEWCELRSGGIRIPHGGTYRSQICRILHLTPQTILSDIKHKKQSIGHRKNILYLLQNHFWLLFCLRSVMHRSDFLIQKWIIFQCVGFIFSTCPWVMHTFLLLLFLFYLKGCAFWVLITLKSVYLKNLHVNWCFCPHGGIMKQAGE